MHGNARIAALFGALALVSTPAPAAEEAAPAARMGQGWTLLGAQTVGDGANVIAVEAGFPSLGVTYLRGVTSIEDVGVRLAFNYGYEGLVSTIVPGMRLEGLGRLRLLDTGHVNIGVKGGVGLFAYFNPNTVPGITIPLSLAVGIPVGSAFSIATGVDAPLFITFGGTGGLTAPILFHAGLEYWLSKTWEANLDARMGPAINVTGPFASVVVGTSQIAFNLTVGMAFKL